MSCPICKKKTDKAFRPFCSKRCADVDLGRWLTEGYAIPGPPEEPEGPDASPHSEERRLH